MKKNNRNELINILVNGYIDKYKAEFHGSDVVERLIIKGIKKIELQKYTSPIKYLFRSKDGSFFKYINTSKIDLTRYQIIRNTDDINIINENCLIYALRLLKINENLLTSIKSKIEYGAYINKKNLKDIAPIIQKNIYLHQYRIKNNTPEKFIIKIVSDATYDTIHLALYDAHYFIYEEMNMTKYAINNYNTINDIKDYHLINKTKNNNNEKADSLYVIKKLKDHGQFKEDAIIHQSVQHVMNNNNTCIIDNLINEQELYNYNTSDKKNKDIFFADTETDTTGIHTPILIGVIKLFDKNNIDNVRTYERTTTLEAMVCEFLTYVINQSKVENDIIIYFHNLKYDLFALLSSIYLIGLCEKDNSIYSTKIIFKKRIIEFRDTYKLASMKLSDFNEAFALPKELNKKEYIAYSYYTVNNMKDTKINLDTYTRHMKPEDIEPFYKLMNDEGKDNFTYDKATNTFNPIEYYIHYLKYDCLVLCEGMKIFNKSILEITNKKMCVFDYLTISSLTNSYFGMMGAFDGVYKMTGCLRDYVSKAITGGRVQVLEAQAKKTIQKKIADYDAVSLYPSAIYRLCNESGLPLGMAKKIINFNDMKITDYYIVNIKITKINKKQQLPFISYKENGILQYTNDIPACGYIEVCIDSTTLNDYKEFHKIEFEFIDGVYWNEGYNKKMGQCVYDLFNERLRYKSLDNEAMQLIIKLMLNSSYGKTIIKKSVVEKKIIKNESIPDFINKYFNQIKNIEVLNKNQALATLSTMDHSYNLAHVGVSILSMSKRIMNEVFDIANNNNIEIYYTDTDSMHLNYDDVRKLECLYKSKYNSVLNGKNMGQFHVDFKLKGTDKKSEIYAIESLFLGKKAYIDKLECINKDGSITHGYHYRLKGMTTEGIIDGTKKFNNDVFKMFQYMANNKLELTLNPENKFMIEYVNNKIQTRGTFKRTMEF